MWWVCKIPSVGEQPPFMDLPKRWVVREEEKSLRHGKRHHRWYASKNKDLNNSQREAKWPFAFVSHLSVWTYEIVNPGGKGVLEPRCIAVRNEMSSVYWDRVVSSMSSIGLGLFWAGVRSLWRSWGLGVCPSTCSCSKFEPSLGREAPIKPCKHAENVSASYLLYLSSISSL